jgi:hypothetical protein
VWRESWTNVVDVASSQDYTRAIVERLDLHPEAPQWQRRHWILTATVAAGVSGFSLYTRGWCEAMDRNFVSWELLQ